jgi:hypothetical protein
MHVLTRCAEAIKDESYPDPVTPVTPVALRSHSESYAFMANDDDFIIAVASNGGKAAETI